MTQFWLCLVLLGAFLQCISGFDMDGACRSNGMRKPPRFGKRAGEDEFNAENQFNVPETGNGLTKRAAGCFRGGVRRRTLRQFGAGTRDPTDVIKRYIQNLASARVPEVTVALPVEPAQVKQFVDPSSSQQQMDGVNQSGPKSLRDLLARQRPLIAAVNELASELE